ncbi:hypothetical protein GWI33_018896 [Rhynchophorus ferrugineus]|uniref:Uncharacterized protein n=1 Tax=Rhynchophorus ferrugineus TaxID=354439 RepID=A0A834M7J8_RHYFE|nr:hypothetical protein GWI33_018896 [Rhynchophorus ferrugineus]
MLLEWRKMSHPKSSSHSPSSYTPSSSPLSLDLDDIAANTAATSPSPVAKRPAPSPTLPSRCTAVPPQDLHSDVINLERTPFAHQWRFPSESRDARFRRSTSATAVPPLTSSLSDGVGRMSTTETLVTSCTCSDACSTAVSGGVSMSSAASTQNVVVPVEEGAAGGSGPKTSADESLNAVNIVGLPRFQNQGHVAMYPHHFRNVSEPATQFFRYPAAAAVHQKPTANQQQHGVQLINHFRSSSVPKSIALASKYDVTANSSVINNNNIARSPPTRPPAPPNPNGVLEGASVQNIKPNNANVSNINVNFYRAVPVNVVASVPTIHCMNTLTNSQGNSVSNVQVLPLGNSNQQLTIPPANGFVNGVNNVQNHGASGIHSTQVTVRSTNAIQIGHGTNDGKIITSTVGYPETNYRNVVSGTTGNVIIHHGADNLRNNPSALQINNVYGLNRNTSFMPSASVGNNVIQIQTNPTPPRAVTYVSEVPYQQGGRIITTTAQINSTTMDAGTSTSIQTPSNTGIVRTRTFTSTEAQTDDILPVQPNSSSQSLPSREQRRRERRERRMNRRANSQGNTSRTTQDSGNQTGPGTSQNDQQLPDILNSHLPPPYSPLPSAQNTSLMSPVPPPPPLLPPPPPPLLPGTVLPNPHAPMLQTVVPNAVPASAFVFPPPPQMAPLMQGAAPVPVAVPATAAGGFRFGFPPSAFRR